MSGLIVAGGLLVERLWYRYFCPLGSFFGQGESE